MHADLLEQANCLSDSEQIALVEAIWNGIVSREAIPSASDSQLQELHRRHAHLLKNPDEVVEWEQVKQEILATLA